MSVNPNPFKLDYTHRQRACELEDYEHEHLAERVAWHEQNESITELHIQGLISANRLLARKLMECGKELDHWRNAAIALKG